MRKRRSFRFSPLLAAFLKDPVLLSVAIVSFSAGYGVQEVFKAPPLSPLIQSPEEIVCQTCFTPTYECLPLVLATIQKAQKTIRMQCYSFTSKEIAQALIETYRKRIKVTIIADKSQRTSSHTQVRELAHQGIEVFFDDKPAIAHNKVIIVDESTVLTGSYNFTEVAENRNAENIIVIKNKDIAQRYIQNFHERLALSSH